MCSFSLSITATSSYLSITSHSVYHASVYLGRAFPFVNLSIAAIG